MTILFFLRDVALLAVMLPASLLPWFVAGRTAIPARERLPVRELGWGGLTATVRRGANSPIWSPAHRDL